jgi:hypothetical protein
MPATPYRSTCTIDGEKFDCVSISVAFATEKDRAGMPQMGSLKTSIRCLIDFHDNQNMPYSTLSKLFDLANVVTRDKVKDMKVEFWKDESHQDALCSYNFKGWISNFHTCNPVNGDKGLNHMLILTLEPALNQQNFKEIRISN